MLRSSGRRLICQLRSPLAVSKAVAAVSSSLASVEANPIRGKHTWQYPRTCLIKSFSKVKIAREKTRVFWLWVDSVNQLIEQTWPGPNTADRRSDRFHSLLLSYVVLRKTLFVGEFEKGTLKSVSECFKNLKPETVLSPRSVHLDEVELQRVGCEHRETELRGLGLRPVLRGRLLRPRGRPQGRGISLI